MPAPVNSRITPPHIIDQENEDVGFFDKPLFQGGKLPCGLFFLFGVWNSRFQVVSCMGGVSVEHQSQPNKYRNQEGTTDKPCVSYQLLHQESPLFHSFLLFSESYCGLSFQ